jgi:hypothetical protein
MKVYRVRHILFDKIEGTKVMAKETVKELFFAVKDDAMKSLSLWLEKSKGKGRNYTEEPVEIDGVRGYYDAHIETMVTVEELSVFQRES